jgi:hypothetical protein
MFEWLEQEIAAVKWPRFHVVDGPPDAKLREAVTTSRARVPAAYKEFVLKFGNAKLYRNLKTGGYRIGVYAAPRISTLDDGTELYHLGSDDGAKIYVKPSADLLQLPIFEYEQEEAKVAETFEEWLLESCARVRRSYGKLKWAKILAGPKPFTAAEQEIIEARRLMRWKVLGIDPEGNHIFEVTNTGKRNFPALTIGVHSKDRRLNGAVRLITSQIRPGQTGVLHADCYKNLVSPKDVEVFALPDPQPESRGEYWELKNTPDGR